MRPKVLVIDTDQESVNLIHRFLGNADYQLVVQNNTDEALQIISGKGIDLIIVEISTPDFDGIKFIHNTKKVYPKIQIIATSSNNDIKTTVEALKNGAFDYLVKPFTGDEVLTKVAKAIEKETLSYTIKKLQHKIKSLSYEDNIIGNSKSILDIIGKLPVIAESDASVLITGESGTGKEIIARAIHYKSARHHSPFIPINCGAIPLNLLESELFGHVKGAFTGAYETKKGLFKEAHTGSIFLDEIGELDPSIQVKLLRALQDQEIKPVGDTQSFKVDVRVISATNKNLENALKDSSFREDLYYRLNVIPVHLPPLRERKEDIPLLAAEFLKEFNKKQKKNIEGFTKFAIEKLMTYHWPGNIRELENKIEYTVIMSSGKLIDADDILISFDKPVDRFKTFKEAKAEFEREYILTVLKINKGNVKAAAQMAGKERKDFYNNLNKYEINPDSFRE
ncbi:sigma-54-dependent transcriptional regulator [candidate division KSB1 bacterium]